MNDKLVDDIIAKVEAYIGDVADTDRLEDPSYQDELREEYWTLAIDAAHDLGLRGEEATARAKAAMDHFGYGDPAKSKKRVEPVWPPQAHKGPRTAESKATTKLDRDIVQAEVEIGKLTQKLDKPDLNEQDRDAFTKERTQWRNHLKALRAKARNESATKVVTKLLAEENREEIEKYWNMVKPVGDWKGPIDKVIPGELSREEKKKIENAIWYYTATEVWFEKVKGGTRVTADGYRMGPAGDH
jgi:hypothetical protein